MMVRSDENYGQHDRIGTEDLVAPGGSDGPDKSNRTDSVQSEQANSEGNVRGDLADDRESLPSNSSKDRQATLGELDGEHSALIESSDSTRFRNRWHDVQAAFVDDPQRAVSDADRLVAELMQTLAATFAERKQALEDQWQKGHEAETEDLRLALRGYRSFFDQLLPH